MASAGLSLYESHHVQNEPTCAGKGSVLDAMRDLDFEWNGSNDFVPLPSDFEHAKPEGQHEVDGEKVSTASPPLWGKSTCPQLINRSSQTNTSMTSFSETSTLCPLPLGISLQSSYLGIIIPDDGSLPSGKRSIVSHKADSGSDTSLSTQQSSTRGRRPSHVVPGSARATCRKKNREAAKKCRSKQKKQQEDLVETALDMERKNRQLKAEVELLKGDMRDLMGIVIQHGSCSDQRLSKYVQRDADRLATIGSLSPVKSEKSPKRGSSSPEMPKDLRLFHKFDSFGG